MDVLSFILKNLVIKEKINCYLPFKSDRIRGVIFLMGVCIAKCVIPCVSKGKTETVSSSAQTLWEIGATDIDGNKYATLRELIPEGRLAVVVNVATK